MNAITEDVIEQNLADLANTIGGQGLLVRLTQPPTIVDPAYPQTGLTGAALEQPSSYGTALPDIMGD